MGVRKVSDLLARVRQVLQDEDSDNYRYPTSDLVGYLNDAVIEAWRLRPDIFVGRFLKDPPQITVLANDSGYAAVAFPLPDTYFVPCYNYVAGRTEFRDDEFAVDNRAMTFMGQFQTMLLGGG
jgi:hypothetical protein